MTRIIERVIYWDETLSFLPNAIYTYSRSFVQSDPPFGYPAVLPGKNISTRRIYEDGVSRLFLELLLVGY
jgi:hypothetical protein